MSKKASRQAERIAAAKARDNAKSDRIIAAAAGARLLAQRSQSRRSGQLAMALALASSVAL